MDERDKESKTEMFKHIAYTVELGWAYGTKV